MAVRDACLSNPNAQTKSILTQTLSPAGTSINANKNRAVRAKRSAPKHNSLPHSPLPGVFTTLFRCRFVKSRRDIALCFLALARLSLRQRTLQYLYFTSFVRLLVYCATKLAPFNIIHEASVIVYKRNLNSPTEIGTDMNHPST